MAAWPTAEGDAVLGVFDGLTLILALFLALTLTLTVALTLALALTLTLTLALALTLTLALILTLTRCTDATAINFDSIATVLEGCVATYPVTHF